MSRESQITTHKFSQANEYNAFLAKEGIGSYGQRAVGFTRTDGSMEVVIDEQYYLSGGITREQLTAIELHEQTELLSESPNAHEEATIAEYAYIFEHFGHEGLLKYHSNLCNLMGGSNEVRNKALHEVLRG